MPKRVKKLWHFAFRRLRDRCQTAIEVPEALRGRVAARKLKRAKKHVTRASGKNEPLPGGVYKAKITEVTVERGRVHVKVEVDDSWAEDERA